MTTKHTPGPLRVVVDQKFPFNLRIVNQDGETVADERRASYSTANRTIEDVMTARGLPPEDKPIAIEANERQLADMHLRAAGPDLLAAAKMCLKAERKRAARILAGATASTYTNERIKALEAAIAKAEGR